MMVKASHETWACYRVIECAKIVLVTQMLKGEGLIVIQERMKTFKADVTDAHFSKNLTEWQERDNDDKHESDPSCSSSDESV